MDKTYIRYGQEWEKEMMKLPKKLLIELLKKEYIRNYSSDQKNPN